MGAVAGAICCWAVGLKHRFGYDDSLDVVGVHLVGGIVGALGIGLLATKLAPTGVAGLLYGGGSPSSVNKPWGPGVVLAFAFTMSGLLGLLIEKTIGFRITRNHEVGGIDLAAHGEAAYELHGTAAGGPAGMACWPI